MVQKQTLQLSPQMYQSIKILQLNSIELNCWLEKEVQDNPVLEININPISDQETMSDAAKKRDEKDVNGERDLLCPIQAKVKNPKNKKDKRNFIFKNLIGKIIS